MTNNHEAARHLALMREHRPLVHNITNYVSMDISANVLLAAGASPAMIHTPEEAGDFAALAGALVLNIGTLSPHWVEGMSSAAAVARAKKTPIVLDPVGAGATPYRTEVAQRLLEAGVTVLRGNASEILALGGDNVGPTRGVDATDEVSAATQAGMALALRHKCVVAITGAVDEVTDGHAILRIEGGHPLMAQVTAMGCSLTSTIGAFLASGPDIPSPLESTAHALLYFGVAGARAGERSEGPGSFRVQFMDALSRVDPTDLEQAPQIRS